MYLYSETLKRFTKTKKMSKISWREQQYQRTDGVSSDSKLAQRSVKIFQHVTKRKSINRNNRNRYPYARAGVSEGNNEALALNGHALNFSKTKDNLSNISRSGGERGGGGEKGGEKGRTVWVAL
jgi:hypothetical protein